MPSLTADAACLGALEWHAWRERFAAHEEWFSGAAHATAHARSDAGTPATTSASTNAPTRRTIEASICL
jgi:hypothetical protein